MILSAEVREGSIFLSLKAGSAENLKPDLFMKAFFVFLGETLPEFSLEIHSICQSSITGQDRLFFQIRLT